MEPLIPITSQLPVIPEGEEKIRVLGYCDGNYYQVTFRNNRFYHIDRHCYSDDWTPYITHFQYLPKLP